jgi:hypothetical protein
LPGNQVKMVTPPPAGGVFAISIIILFIVHY